MSEFVITPGRTGRFLAYVVVSLLVANLLCVYLKYVLGLPHGFIGTFLFGKEFNIPSLYSSLALFVAAVLLFAIARLDEEKTAGRHRYWQALAAVFVFLSIDELLALHEMLTSPTRAVIGDEAGGLLHYAWVVPYVLVFAAAGVLMLKFFFSLPLPAMIRFAAAAFVFLTGAVGLEVVGGRYDFLYVPGESDLTLALLVSIEETLEMSGVVIFIHALLLYYTARLEGDNRIIRLRLEPQEKISPIAESQQNSRKANEEPARMAR